MLEQQFSKRCCCICSFVEDVPSEIVIFGSLQGALGATLGSFLGSHFFILKHCENDVKTILRTSQFFEDVPSEMATFICWSAVLAMLVCRAVPNFPRMSAARTPFLRGEAIKQLFQHAIFVRMSQAKRQFFMHMPNSRLPTLGGCLERNAYFW